MKKGIVRCLGEFDFNKYKNWKQNNKQYEEN